MKRISLSLVSVAVAAAVVATAPAAGARVGDLPLISGDPVVGQTLTSSDAGDSGVYRWQSCDAAISDCSNDAGFTDIAGAGGNGLKTYVLAASDLGRFIRVLAKGTSLGEQFVASEPVGPVVAPSTAAAAAPPPPQGQPPAPQHGIQLIGSTVKGSVEFKPPGHSRYIPLGGQTPIPVGSLIDTRGSEINLVAAIGPFGNETADQSVNFSGAIFRILQSSATNSPAIAKLTQRPKCGKGAGGAKASAGGPIATASRGKRRGRLWGSGSGGYGTSGRGGTGSVVGTTWFTQETCKGTRFGVTEGIGINVFAFSSKKTIPLGPGQSFLARR